LLCNGEWLFVGVGRFLTAFHHEETALSCGGKEEISIGDMKCECAGETHQAAVKMSNIAIHQTMFLGLLGEKPLSLAPLTLTAVFGLSFKSFVSG
jgi:hypothetical protein